MGYWLAIFVCIALEEQILFRSARMKRSRALDRELELEHDDDGMDWDAWHDWKAVPVGIAALAVFPTG
jgi:hypothetical protein